jgi:hypothetical protein
MLSVKQIDLLKTADKAGTFEALCFYGLIMDISDVTQLHADIEEFHQIQEIFNS